MRRMPFKRAETKQTPDNYLENNPIKIFYRIVAGDRNIHRCQMSDLIFDEHDLKIRQLDTEDNIKYWKAANSL